MLEKANKKELYRVGFEEIHKLWSDISYRPAFQFIHRISSAHVPVFGTSGSLPEHLLETLPKMTSTIWKAIRMPSYRKELIYEIRRFPYSHSLEGAIIQHWNEVLTSYREEDRCLVFCKTVGQAKNLAASLGVSPFHRECPDDSAVRKFISGQQKILPTTIKLGCGYHYANIRDVLHMDIAYSIVDQLQEDSRGGRDGLPCRAITFVGENIPRFNDNNEFDLGAQVIYDWSKEKIRCLRIPSSVFIDNVPVTCTLIGGQLCANCTAQLKQSPPALALSLPIPNDHSAPSTPFPTGLKRPIEQETPLVSKRIRLDSFTTPASKGSFTPIRDASSPALVPISKRLMSADSSSLPSSPISVQHDVFSSSQPRGDSSGTPYHLRTNNTPTVLSGPSGRTRVGLGVSMSTLTSRQHDEEWRTTIDTPLCSVVSFLSKNCTICFLEGNQEYMHHRFENCTGGQLRKTDNDFFNFRTTFNYPTKVCYGCGLHTGVSFFFIKNHSNCIT
jgi:hypothetical protein